MTVTYAAFDISDYLDNDEVMAEFLTAAAQDEKPDVLLAALSHVAKARGMAQVAKDAGLGRESLYKALSSGAHPRFENINAVLRALDVEVAIVADGVSGGGGKMASKTRRSRTTFRPTNFPFLNTPFPLQRDVNWLREKAEFQIRQGYSRLHFYEKAAVFIYDLDRPDNLTTVKKLRSAWDFELRNGSQKTIAYAVKALFPNGVPASLEPRQRDAMIARFVRERRWIVPSAQTFWRFFK